MGGGGTVTFLIGVTGTLGVSTLDNAGHSVRADWVTGVSSSTAPGLVVLASGRITDDPGGSTQTGDPMGGMYEWGPIPFSFGASFEVLVQFSGSSSVNFCCSAASNFGSTLTWEGVVEIRDAQEALVENFLIDSGSGEDYGTAIPAPEPISGQLGIAALSAVALLARARSRRPPPKPARGPAKPGQLRLV